MAAIATAATRAFAAHLRASQLKNLPQWKTKFLQWQFKTGYYPQLGLLLHDTYNEDKNMSEAIRRMPEVLQNERLFRMSRAIDLSAKKRILPEEEWTKFEEDYPYLTPFLEEVMAEEQEKIEWNKL